ncbi:hypothetical protein ACLOJK_013977 [Asimina triloba]
MLHLQPATGNHADAAVDHIHTPNGHMGESDSLQVHPQSPRIHRNHQSFSDSRGFQSEVSTWKTARYHQNSSNLNRSASGALTWSVDSHGNKFGNPNDVGFSLAARRTPGHRESNKESDGIEFHAQMQTEEDPDASSPPLWKTGPPAAPAIKVSSPSHYAQLSPASRSQAIARGRQELMRLVQDMPESSYELSLKDLVETSASGKNFEEASREDERALVHKTIKEDKAIKGKRSCRRRELQSRNMQSGAFLIKMFSPSALGSLRRSSSTGTSSRVSPRPMPVEEKSSDDEEEECIEDMFVQSRIKFAIVPSSRKLTRRSLTSLLMAGIWMASYQAAGPFSASTKPKAEVIEVACSDQKDNICECSFISVILVHCSDGYLGSVDNQQKP